MRPASWKGWRWTEGDNTVSSVAARHLGRHVSGTSKPFPQFVKRIAQVGGFLLRHACRAENAIRDMAQIAMQDTPFFGQLNQRLPFVRCISFPAYDAVYLQPFQQGCQCAGIKRHLCTDGFDIVRRTICQREHNKILRICQAKRVKQRSVDAVHGMVSCIDRKTQQV